VSRMKRRTFLQVATAAPFVLWDWLHSVKAATIHESHIIEPETPTRHRTFEVWEIVGFDHDGQAVWKQLQGETEYVPSKDLLYLQGQR